MQGDFRVVGGRTSVTTGGCAWRVARRGCAAHRSADHGRPPAPPTADETDARFGVGAGDSDLAVATSCPYSRIEVISVCRSRTDWLYTPKCILKHENRTEKQVSSSAAAQCGDRARAGGEEEQDVHAARWHGVGACRQREKNETQACISLVLSAPRCRPEMPPSSFWAQTTATWLH